MEGAIVAPPMNTEIILSFVLIVAIGTYVQTVTGFALGLIVMGAVTLLDIAPVAFSAVVVSVTSLVNIALALRKNHHHIARREMLYASLGMIPALLLGLLLLDLLSGEATRTLKTLLGVFILIGGTLLMLKPQPRLAPSSRLMDFNMGFLGGFFGGLFSTAGPPLVYHLYRQPYTIDMIRSTLLAIFGLITLLRNGYVIAVGDFTLDMLIVSLWCLPAVWLATLAGQKFAPPLPEQGMRRLAFTLLAALGLTLILS